MEKLKFKNGEVVVITDIDEIVKDAININYGFEWNDCHRKTVETYLRKKKPNKCIHLKQKKFNRTFESIMFYYSEKNGGKYYSAYNGLAYMSIFYDILWDLFLDYYKTVNDDYRINDLLKIVHVGDDFFYRIEYGSKYIKGTVKEIKMYLCHNEPRILIKTTAFKSNILPKGINKDKSIKCDNGTYYPFSLKQEIEEKILVNKKKRLKSLERSMAKLKNEIENKIIW